MKPLLFPLLCILSLGLLGTRELLSQTINVDFSSPTVMSVFVQNRVAGGGNSELIQADNVGTGTPPGGGLIFSPTSAGADITEINTTKFSYLSDLKQINFSLDLHKAGYTSSSGLLASVGFSSATNFPFSTTGTGVDQLQFRIQETANNTIQLQLVNRTAAGGSSTTSLGSVISVLNSNTDWYRITFSLTLSNPATSEFSFQVGLYSIGSDGGGLPILLQPAVGVAINAGLASSTDIYAGFRLIQTGVSSVDNLNVVAVPEANALLLLEMGAGTLLLVRRRIFQARFTSLALFCA